MYLTKLLELKLYYVEKLSSFWLVYCIQSEPICTGIKIFIDQNELQCYTFKFQFQNKSNIEAKYQILFYLFCNLHENAFTWFLQVLLWALNNALSKREPS